MALLPRLLLFLFASGFCALVYQMAWLRLLRLVFGASTAASAAVLAIFMGGLGVGSLLLGRRAERSRNPLRLYAHLEIGIALSAALSPWLIGAIRWVYVGLGGSFTLGSTGGTGLRLLLSVLVLGLPTFLMGGTLPAAVRAATAKADLGRRALGRIYALNTLGAVVGATLTTFWALEAFGVRKTVWLAALVNLLVAMAARSAARRQGAVDPIESTEAVRSSAEPSGEQALAPVRLLLVAAAVVGFAFFLMELVWYRMLAPVLGGSTYTFGIILAVALTGIGLGGLVYGSGQSRRRPTLGLFAATCAAEALFVALPFVLGDRLAFLAQALRRLEVFGFAGLIIGWILVTAIVVLPAALLAGYQFPLLVGVLGAARNRVAREVGLAYAWNTGGAIFGSLAGGFGLIPLLSAPGAWKLSAWVLLLLSGVCALQARREGGEPLWPSLPVAGLAALLLLVATGPGAYWRHGGVGAGRSGVDADSPNSFRDALHLEERSVVWELDGRESSVALIGSGGLSFSINGKTDGNCRSDAPTQVMSPLVGALLHPAPQTGLVIGLGTGSSAGWLAEVETIERVDVVEIEPAVLRVAEACAAVNQNVLEHPKVTTILADGRELLLTTDRRYDVIFSEPSNPYRAGIASLFALEFYEAAAARLNGGGLFLQWLQAYEVDAEVVYSIYATLGAVFAEVETWEVHKGDLLLVASMEPVDHDLGRIAREVRRTPYREALESAWGVHGLEGFYAGFVASADFTRALAQASPWQVNTEDHPVVEFGFARSVGQRVPFTTQELRALAERIDLHRPRVRPGELDELDELRLRERQAARQAMFGDDSWSRFLPAPEDQAARMRARRAFTSADLPKVGREWVRQPLAPEARIDLALAAEGLAELGDDRFGALLEELRRIQPVEADAVEARWLFRTGRSGEAAERLARAFEGYRSSPWPHELVMRRALELAPKVGAQDAASARRLFASLAEPFALRMWDELRRGARVLLARRADFDGLCQEAISAYEPYPIWRRTFLETRRDCYRRGGHELAARAERDLADYLAREPRPLDTWLLGPEERLEGNKGADPPIDGPLDGR